MKRLAWLLFSCVLLFGCANYPPLPDAGTGPYRLDSGDVVRVLVYNEPNLSASYTVGEDGAILLPVIGAVQARGLTVDQLQAAIATKLRTGNILTNPGVGVEVSQYRPFYIIGEVNKPGQYPYVAGLNALGAVAVGGGFTVRADEDRLRVVRKEGGSSSSEWRALRSSPIQPGDVLVVPERFF
jgi:polysaccharide export outer membrane protein